MRREQHGLARRARAAHYLFENDPTLFVEAGMRFVQQQQSRRARERVCERDSPALALGEPAVRGVRDPLQSDALERGVGIFGAATTRAGREPQVLADGEIVVTERLVPDERDRAADRPATGREVDTEHLTGAGAQRQQPRAQSQQRRLSRAVRACKENSLAGVYLEVDTRERGETTQHAHGRPKAYDAQKSLLRGVRRYQVSLRTGGRARRTNPPPAREPSARAGTIDGVRRTIAGIGRTLVTLGLLILLFVAYQLWGTGIFTARAQDSLKSNFTKAQQLYTQENDTVGPITTTVPPTTSTSPSLPTSTTTTTSPARPAPPTPPEGDAEGLITIPRIGLNMIFVEGTSRDDLKKGPGHYPSTPMPGTIGNAAIAGHRTTYLHPFWGLDNLQVGDDIIIQTVAGKFDYQVYRPKFATGPTAWFVVNPTDVWVADNTPDAELTLTACHPKYSAEHRIVIRARLVPNKSAKPSKPRPPAKQSSTGHGKARPDATLAEGLSGQERSLTPTVLWGVIAALVGLVWWWTFRRWRHPATWIVGVVPFLIALFPFYVYLERALPAGY